MKFGLHSLPLLLLLSAPLLLSLGCETVTSHLHVGQRLLVFEILFDEEVQFAGLRGVNDNMPIHQMWDSLPNITFEPVDKETKTNTSNQTILTYQGKIVIRIKHVENELDSISTETLTLSKLAETNSWSLNQQEIDRLKHLLNQR